LQEKIENAVSDFGTNANLIFRRKIPLNIDERLEEDKNPRFSIGQPSLFLM